VIRFISAFSLLFAAFAVPAAAQAPTTLVLETTKGPVTIKLRTDLAPKHAAQIAKLARAGFYDGIIFHRVIDGFMAQTGDPTGTGTGQSNEPDIKAEFSSEPFVRGVVGMARSSDPNSANSQFFIMFSEYPSLNGQYTVVGQVVSGMENVDKIKRGEPPANPDKIIKATAP
jgi:peptidylprolyl isomerase